jgi:hypothetical protein
MIADSRTLITNARCMARPIAVSSRAPTACEMIGSSAISTPIPKIDMLKKYMLPSATAPRASAERWPTMMVSTTPMSMMPA